MATEAAEPVTAVSRILAALNSPRDAAGLAAFRVMFGALMLFSVVRFVANGWVDAFYIAPSFHFTYIGFEWVRPWSPWAMYLHFALMGLAALSILLGAWTRVSAAIFFVTFTCAELFDKTTYLNHYYLVSLISLLLIFVPAGSTWSIDAVRVRRSGTVFVGAWAYGLLRTQVGLVYLFAGLAKLNEDWLLHAQPLRTWLQAFTHVPLLGSLFEKPWPAFAMSWAGAVYDLTIVAFLVWRRTRTLAYCAAVAFHVAIWLLFPIGIFSWVMLLSSSLFFEPDWPRKLWRRLVGTPGIPAAAPASPCGRMPRGGLLVACLYLSIQILVPLRFVLYPGQVNWTEEAFRFSWRVMLIEKSGQVEYEVVTEGPERRFVVYPRAELTLLQYRMMSTQPDMIHEFALHLRDRFAGQGYGAVHVYARAFAALCGRPSQHLVDPSVDLAAQPRSLWPKRWIVPLGQAPLRDSPAHANRLTSSALTPSAASAPGSFDR